MFVSLLVQKLTAALIFLPTIIIYFIAADYSRNNYCDNRIVVSAIESHQLKLNKFE
jgi:hypothetical protein